ncbi:uncharacterized protein LOC135074565 [Ostrinia nubilalis]|uniref:uncharacterized protein LOC135074565 n=1 Tax=Ostrinia nubilalis TaxID=29057 RepID=UPI0030822A7E
MVKKLEKPFRKGRGQSNHIQADVIILGCSLPGIVTAHKLKRKFGNTMDIVVLDMAETSRLVSKCNVAFFTDHDDDAESDNPETGIDDDEDDDEAKVTDNVARHYITKYARDLNIPIPEAIIEPVRMKSPLNKLFQHTNGSTVEFSKDFHNFDYLGFIEKFELNQYQSLLDHSMRDMFHTREATDADRKKLLYYDQTTMEQHLCSALIFSTSRDIMRTTVRVVCGAPADSISVLFYLHQCYRTNSCRNHLDGDNTRFREKLLGYCRKRLTNQLQRSIADIILSSNPIKEISTYSDELVILKTMKGGTNYVCNLLAMALRPDELHKIRVEDQLLARKDADITSAMRPGRAKKFVVQYENNFWEAQGYSGDILSIRGPIIWAMERPKFSTTGSLSRYATLTGYIMVRDKADADDSRVAVLEQLVKLFGEEAASPVSYTETDIADIFVPRCGDYVALRKLTGQVTRRYLEWGALDVFAEGDVAAALEAGHTTYLHLLSCLRPQAQTYEDLSSSEWPITLSASPLERWFSQINYKSSMRFAFYTTVIYLGVKLVQSYMRKSG